MLITMPNELTPQDRNSLTRLGIETQEIALLQVKLDAKRKLQKTLVIDLVQREIISQSRASKIAEVQRQTISRWLQEAFEAPLSEEDRIALRYSELQQRD